MSTVTTTASDSTPAAEPPAPSPARRTNWIGVLVGIVVVIGLAALTRYLDKNVPVWTADTAFGKIAKSIEYPVYAIAIGLIGNAIITALRVRDALAPAFRTELFIKTGLVLLGISVNLSVIWKAAGPAIIQALILITSVFFFAWWLGGKLGLDEKLRALLGTAVSICGVSAAIAAAIEPRRPGPVTAAAELFDHAAREPNGHVARATPRSWDLRSLSRLVHLMGRLSGDKDTSAMLVLLLELARLADALESLRHAQQRVHQAEAARRAAESLRAAAGNTTGRLGSPPATVAADLTGLPADTPTIIQPVAESSTRDEPALRGR